MTDIPDTEQEDTSPVVTPPRLQRSAAQASTAITSVRSSHEQGLDRAREMLEAGNNLKALTAKQSTFVQAVADGATAAEAYRFAYDCLHEKPSIITARASYLMGIPHIAHALYEARVKLESRVLKDRDQAQRYVIEHLQRVVESPGTHHSARVGALSLLGKYSGLFGDAGAAQEKDRRPSAVLEMELRSKLMSVLGNEGLGRVISVQHPEVSLEDNDVHPDVTEVTESK